MRSIYIICIIVLTPLSVHSFSVGDFELNQFNDPPIFTNVYDSSGLIETGLDVLFFAQVNDVDNSSSELTVLLFYSNDTFVLDNNSQAMSYSQTIAPDTYEYTYLFDGQPVGTYLQYYFTVYDALNRVRSPTNPSLLYDIQWGVVVGGGGGSGGGGGGGFEFTGNIRLNIRVVYRFTDVGDARVQITLYEDFFKQIKIASFQTYTDSSGGAMVRIQADVGDWIEIHVYAVWDGDDKEAEVQEQVNNIDSTISITINLYDGFFGIDNSLVREYIKGFVAISLFLVFLVIAYIYYRRNYRRDDLLRPITTPSRKNELYGGRLTSRRFNRGNKRRKLNL